MQILIPILIPFLYLAVGLGIWNWLRAVQCNVNNSAYYKEAIWFLVRIGIWTSNVNLTLEQNIFGPSTTTLKCCILRIAFMFINKILVNVITMRVRLNLFDTVNCTLLAALSRPQIRSHMFLSRGKLYPFTTKRARPYFSMSLPQSTSIGQNVVI